MFFYFLSVYRNTFCDLQHRYVDLQYNILGYRFDYIKAAVQMNRVARNISLPAYCCCKQSHTSVTEVQNLKINLIVYFLDDIYLKWNTMEFCH